MSEEEKEIKISFPLFTNIEEAELENTLNFHLDEFVNEINKTMSKDKDIIILKKVIEKQQKEIETLELTNNYLDIANKDYISKDKIRELLNKDVGQYMKFYREIEELLEE